MTCEPENCPMGEYIPKCLKCYAIQTRCATCGKDITFPVGDEERGDFFVRMLPVDDWMCSLCCAQQIGVSSRDIDRTRQIKLEDF